MFQYKYILCVVISFTCYMQKIKCTYIFKTYSILFINVHVGRTFFTSKEILNLLEFFNKEYMFLYNHNQTTLLIQIIITENGGSQNI